MKTLQNNFTTPEQSKRLLELGVPADSADCRFETAVHDGGIKQTYRILGSPIHSNDTPCWSVGRLIEIWDICGNTCECVTAKRNETRTELLVKLYEENATCADFSKLEE